MATKRKKVRPFPQQRIHALEGGWSGAKKRVVGHTYTHTYTHTHDNGYNNF